MAMEIEGEVDPRAVTQAVYSEWRLGDLTLYELPFQRYSYLNEWLENYFEKDWRHHRYAGEGGIVVAYYILGLEIDHLPTDHKVDIVADYPKAINVFVDAHTWFKKFLEWGEENLSDDFNNSMTMDVLVDIMLEMMGSNVVTIPFKHESDATLTKLVWG